MARNEITIQIKMEPSEEALQISKHMLEMWVNGDPYRYIQIEEQYTDDGRRVHLNLMREDMDERVRH